MKKLTLILFMVAALGTVSAEVPEPPCGAANCQGYTVGYSITVLMPMMFNGVWNWYMTKIWGK